MIPDVRDPGVVIPGVEGPPIKDQAPVPTVGLVAFMLAVPGEAHTVCGDPALAADGFAFTVIATASAELGQGLFEMVQVSV